MCSVYRTVVQESFNSCGVSSLGYKYCLIIPNLNNSLPYSQLDAQFICGSFASVPTADGLSYTLATFVSTDGEMMTGDAREGRARLLQVKSVYLSSTMNTNLINSYFENRFLTEP